MQKKLNIYIAGPEVFYRDGSAVLGDMRLRAELKGFGVTLPNDDQLHLGHEDLRRNADEIFWNCAASMNKSDVIICDLEFYRGFEPDGGSIYEIGMAYGRGIRCYTYTRDKRPMVWKDPTIVLRDGQAYDTDGRPYPYADLPFCPSVMAATTLVEGDFDDALAQLLLDVEAERKGAGLRTDGQALVPGATLAPGDRPRVYLAGPERYDIDAAATLATMVEMCAELGLEAITPLDDAPGVPRIDTDDPLTRAANTFDHWQQHVRNCDAIVANLSDYHGREPNSDTSFECGLAFQIGKRLYGYMSDARRMIDRIPNLGAEAEYRDLCGANVENFDYPINLMFASSMPVFEGDFATAIRRVAEELGTI